MVYTRQLTHSRRPILNEGKHPHPLPVCLSKRIKNYIHRIERFNWDKQEAVTRWREYINTVINYIEQPSVAFDYAGRAWCTHYCTMFNYDLGYNIGYKIMVDNYDEAFVFVFKMNLQPENFGLLIPQTKKKHSSQKIYTVTEPKLRHIIKEAVRQILIQLNTHPVAA